VNTRNDVDTISPVAKSLRSALLNRREVGKLVLGGALGAALSVDVPQGFGAVRPQPPGIKIGCAASTNPTDDDLLFYKQLGVEYVFLSVWPGSPQDSVEGILEIKKRYEDAGLRIHNVRNMLVTTGLADVVLNGPARDKKIEDFKRWLRITGQAGLGYTVAMFSAAGVLSSGVTEARGASQVRDVDIASANLDAGLGPGTVPDARPQPAAAPGSAAGAGAIPIRGAAKTLLFGREYSTEEIWANWTYFVKQIAPVAESEGVAIGFHPDDPPAPNLYGVPRIFASFDGCRKALEIANSLNVGMCLCCGTWLEGGAAMGTDPAGAVRYFGKEKKVFEIHFRNVSSPLPHFHETYVDEGYYDMSKIMDALVDVQYDGIVHLDHYVPMVGGNRSYEAFAVGYMKGLLRSQQGRI
jgi:mannonate dehydratase